MYLFFWNFQVGIGKSSPFFVTARVTNYFRNNGKEMSTLANYLSLKLAKSLVLLETTRLLDTLKK